MERKTTRIDVEAIVEKINGHSSHFKELSRDNSQDIIEFVKKITYPYFINVNYENLACLDTHPSFRLVLSTKKNSSRVNFGHQLVRECNGVILLVEETDTAIVCRLVAKPARECNPRVNNPRQINSHIRSGNYHIYFAEDGTTINLYWLQRTGEEGRWVCGSRNSYDIEAVEWRGYSYGVLLPEVLAKFPDFSFDKLDKNNTYTIGFRHPAHHPFGQPVPWTGDSSVAEFDMRAWFIQSTNVLTDEITYIDDIGLPTQVSTHINAAGGQYWQSINRSKQDALKRFQEKKGHPFLGYVLRSRKRDATRHYSDILIESSLLTELRNAIYQLPYIKNPQELSAAKENFKNFQYVLVEAYLDFYNRRLVFEMLFPQYKGLFESYDNSVADAIDIMYDRISTGTHRAEPNWDTTVSSGKLAVYFMQVVESAVSINDSEVMESPTDAEKVIRSVKDHKKMIRTVMIHPRYTEQFLNVFEQ